MQLCISASVPLGISLQDSGSWFKKCLASLKSEEAIE